MHLYISSFSFANADSWIFTRILGSQRFLVVDGVTRCYVRVVIAGVVIGYPLREVYLTNLFMGLLSLFPDS